MRTLKRPNRQKKRLRSRSKLQKWKWSNLTTNDCASCRHSSHRLVSTSSSATGATDTAKSFTSPAASSATKKTSSSTRN